MKACKLITAVCLMVLATTMFATAGTLLHDDFSGSAVSSARWNIPTWVSPWDGTYVGRTQFRCSQNSGLPKCAGSAAVIKLETYNPTGHSFYGTDLISKVAFSRPNNDVLVVTARLKVNQIRPGTVFAFFLYNAPGGGFYHDEIDFELVGNSPYQFNTNIYGDEPLGTGNPLAVPYTWGTIADYHEYAIWWAAGMVTWFVDGIVARQVTTQSPIPQGPMFLHFNAWAPDQEWPEAYDGSIGPVGSARENETWSMNVDWVTVETGSVQIPTQLAVSDSVLELDISKKATLLAECLDQNGNTIAGSKFKWASRNNKVATVNASGVVTAVAEGSTEIVVTSGFLSATVEVDVLPPYIVITQVAPLGERGYVSGIVSPGYSLYDVAVFIKVAGGWWTKPYYAGPLTFIGSGGKWKTAITTGGIDELATEVRAYLLPKGVVPELVGGGPIPDSYSRYQYASIIRQSPPIKRIALYKTTVTIKVGDYGVAPVNVYAVDGQLVYNTPMNLVSSNPAVASVDEYGLITGVSIGTIKVTASVNTTTGPKSAVFTVKVVKKP